MLGDGDISGNFPMAVCSLLGSNELEFLAVKLSLKIAVFAKEIFGKGTLFCSIYFEIDPANFLGCINPESSLKSKVQ